MFPIQNTPVPGTEGVNMNHRGLPDVEVGLNLTSEGAAADTGMLASEGAAADTGILASEGASVDTKMVKQKNEKNESNGRFKNERHLIQNKFSDVSNK